MIIRFKTIIFLLSALMISCDYSYFSDRDDIMGYTLNPVIAVPLVNSEFTLENMLEINDYSFVEVDENGLVTLVYKGEIFSVEANQIFNISDQSNNIRFSNIVPPASGSITLPPQVFSFPFTFSDNQKISSVSFLEGILALNLKATQLQQDGYSISAQYRIINSKNQKGEVITGTVSLNNPSAINLSGSTILFNNQNNSFAVEYTLTISGNGNPVHSPYSVDLLHSVNNMQYDMVKGYIDRIDFLVGSTTIPINLFNKTKSARITFADPVIDITVNNSFGLPVSITAEDFFARCTTDGIINIDGPAFDSPWTINYPLTPDIESVSTSKIIDNNTSNLFDITQHSPYEVFLNVRGLTNPDADIKTTHWLRHDSRLNINTDIKLPLHGQINFFNVSDTVSMSIDTIPGELDWIEMKINVQNGFPIEAMLKVYMLDENHNILDTLFKSTPYVLRAAEVNPASGMVSSPALHAIVEMFNGVKLDKLKQTRYLVVDAHLETFEQEKNTSIKILDSYRMGVQLGMRASARKEFSF